MSPTIVLQYNTGRKNVPFRTYLVKVGEEEPELAGLEAWSQGINATSSPVPKINKIGRFILFGKVWSLLL